MTHQKPGLSIEMLYEVLPITTPFQLWMSDNSSCRRVLNNYCSILYCTDNELGAILSQLVDNLRFRASKCISEGLRWLICPFILRKSQALVIFAWKWKNRNQVQILHLKWCAWQTAALLRASSSVKFTPVVERGAKIHRCAAIKTEWMKLRKERSHNMASMKI